MAQINKQTLLVVDDEPEILSLLTEFLEPDYSVLRALNVKEAIELFEKNSVDLIITDIAMPGYSGEKLIEHIASVDATRPIIAFSGLPEKRAAILTRGASIWLDKPFRHAELMAAVSQLLSR